jgi:uncharacterized SAM-binding protein YcdF (DUF218 family)
VIGQAVLVVLLLLAVAGVASTVWLLRRLWKTESSPTKAVAGVTTTLMMFGAGGTVMGVVKAFGAIGGESVDPSQKARILAEGISEAMNCMAFSSAVWVPSVIAALLITRRRRRASVLE